MRMRKSPLVAFSHRIVYYIVTPRILLPPLEAPFIQSSCSFATFHFNTRRPGTLPFPQWPLKTVECNRVRSTRWCPSCRCFVLISCSLFCFSYFSGILYFAHRSRCTRGPDNCSQARNDKRETRNGK